MWILALPALPAMAQQPAEDAPTQSSPAAEEAPPSKDGPTTTGSLEDFLQEEVPPASVGSFGYRLRRYGITPYIHGVLASNLLQFNKLAGDAPARYGSELLDAHLYIGADILDVVVPEVFLELEPLQFFGSAFQWLNVRYAQIDFRLLREHLVMRTGIFLIPFGTYNTYSYPHFITRLPDRPGFFQELIPSPWHEVGVQFFGEWEYAPGRVLSYAFYVTNGRVQPDFNDPSNPNDDGIDEGGSLAFFGPTFVEDTNNAKSVGARVAVEVIKGLSIGASAYTGAYTVNGARQLSELGVDTSFQRGPLSVDVEAAYAHQQITDGALDKWGYAAVVAYRAHSMLEPLVAVDEVRLDGQPQNDRRTWSVGCGFFPFPDKVPTAVGRAVYGATVHRGEGGTDHRLTVEVAVGF
ncbi:hypothetical protein [Hyalangium versicolor]|uniref:hypothetical protein n=1 Tax=Hyalangium versicolor TaxID=2861190 RepID=UPI001CCDBAF6|nr:hypothetical protein [Hyalangium versicolor]